MDDMCKSVIEQALPSDGMSHTHKQAHILHVHTVHTCIHAYIHQHVHEDTHNMSILYITAPVVPPHTFPLLNHTKGSSSRGHATSYSARIDGIVLSVTKNNVSG